MDPTATLANIRRLQEEASNARTHEEAADLYGEMSVAFNELDEWLSRGGMLPIEWELQRAA